MKKLVVTLLTLCCLTAVYTDLQAQCAQPDSLKCTEHAKKHKRPMHKKNHEKQPLRPDFGREIEMFVKDLSSEQKDQLHELSKIKKQKIQELRKQKGAVRDSIREMMNVSGDQSEKLFPMFEREAMTNVEIEKAYYESRISMEAILTPEQLKELHEKVSVFHQKMVRDTNSGKKLKKWGKARMKKHTDKQ